MQNVTFFIIDALGSGSGNGTASPDGNSAGGGDSEIHFNENNVVSVAVYCVMFVVSGVTNVAVLVSLWCRRRGRGMYGATTRMDIFMLHLVLADLIITFIMIPLEVGWHITVSWRAGDVACRVFMFLRTFGFYLASFILVVISLDTYMAIRTPLRLADARTRSKIMLAFAWILSIIASIPQVRLELFHGSLFIC